MKVGILCREEETRLSRQGGEGNGGNFQEESRHLGRRRTLCNLIFYNWYQLLHNLTPTPMCDWDNSISYNCYFVREPFRDQNDIWFWLQVLGEPNTTFGYLAWYPDDEEQNWHFMAPTVFRRISKSEFPIFSNLYILSV